MMKLLTEEKKTRRFLIDPVDLHPPGPSVILKGGEDPKRRRTQIQM